MIIQIIFNHSVSLFILDAAIEISLTTFTDVIFIIVRQRHVRYNLIVIMLK